MFAYLEGVPGGSDLENWLSILRSQLNHTEEFLQCSNSFSIFVICFRLLL